MMRLLILLFALTLIPGAMGEVSEHGGFPKEFPADVSNAITIADINNDGSPEIVVAPNIRSVYVYSSTGNMLWKAAAGNEAPLVTTSPLAADVNGDGFSEVIIAGGSYVPGTTDYINQLYIFSSNGALLKSYDIGKGYASSSPAFASGLVLVGISGSFTGINAYDMSGLRWQLPFSGGSERMNSIAVGDIDGDGRSEAVLAGGGIVTVVDITASGGSVRWQKDLAGAISPVIMNIKGKKVVVASGSSGTFAWDAYGVQLWSSPVAARYYPDTYSSPAVADINNDGSDDVIIVNDFSVYAISGMDGSMLFKASTVTFPQGSFRARPAIYDINKDSKPEIIIGDSNGNLYIWDSTGKLLDGFPVRITNRVKAMHSSPAVYDLEGDGIPEVVIGSATHLHVVSVKTKNTDTIPPVTTDNADGLWHNSDVTVTFTASDEASGVAATYYTVDGSEPTKDSAKGTTVTLSEDGVYTIKYFSVDTAGNVEPVKTALNQVRIDKTPPSTADNSDSTWHNSSVVIALSAFDSGSGVAATYYTLDGSEPTRGDTITINSEGVHTLKYYSVDNAGNVEQTREAQAKIDSTPPSTIDDSDNRWHNTDVTLDITASDNLSGVAFMRYTVDGLEQVSYSGNAQITVTKESVHTIKYYSADNAGNREEMKAAVINIDKTPPFTSDDSDGAWHNTSVTVNLSASDNLAGVNTTYYNVVSGSTTWIESLFTWFNSAMGFTGKTASQGDAISIIDEGVFNIQYYSDDNAGNIEPEKTAKQVKIDKTPPLITGATTTSPNSNGWYNTDVLVHFTASDGLSGIDAVTPDVTISTEGASQSVSGTATDKAGNSKNTAVSGINIDKTPPAITVNSPQNKTYLHSDIITLGFAASDALSGVKTTSSTIDGSVQVSYGQTLDMLALGFGAHEFYISAEDNAGNLNSRRVGFNVIATIDSLAALTERGSSAAITGQGGSGAWITSSGVAGSLKAKIDSARAKIDAGQKTAARNILEAYINEVDAQRGKAITSEGAGILRAEAKYVIDHL